MQLVAATFFFGPSAYKRHPRPLRPPCTRHPGRLPASVGGRIGPAPLPKVAILACSARWAAFFYTADGCETKRARRPRGDPVPCRAPLNGVGWALRAYGHMRGAAGASLTTTHRLSCIGTAIATYLCLALAPCATITALLEPGGISQCEHLAAALRLQSAQAAPTHHAPLPCRCRFVPRTGRAHGGTEGGNPAAALSGP